MYYSTALFKGEEPVYSLWEYDLNSRGPSLKWLKATVKVPIDIVRFWGKFVAYLRIYIKKKYKSIFTYI